MTPPLTVVWHAGAEKLLAEIWLQATDRPSIGEASNEIDRLLRTNPETRGRRLNQRTRCVSVPPLQVVFEVIDADRLVRIAHVRRVPALDHFEESSNGHH